MKIFQQIKVFLPLVIIVALLMQSQPAMATQEEKTEKSSFNLKEMIFSHIMDSYDWHLISLGEKHYAIPLPIIVKSQERGWFVFSSSRLAHGETYEGFYLSQDEKRKGKVVEINTSGEEIRPFDLSYTKNAASITLTCILLLVIFLFMAKGYKKNPLQSRRGLIGSLEMLIISIQDDVIKPCVGKDYKRFTPYLLTAFFFIFITNLLGLIPIFPGGANVTGNISVTLVLALCTFFITNAFGTKEYWKEIFWPDVPLWLKAPIPIMPLVEFLSVLTKPFALMVRLFANMMAGHMILLVLVGLIFIFTAVIGPAAGGAASVVSILFSIFMLCLDVLVSFIQAYVFTMLSAIFIGMGRVEPHHK